MKNSVKLVYAITILSLVAGCGDTPGRRAATGAGIGAGAGAVGAVLLDANPVAGALIGGGSGGGDWSSNQQEAN